MIGRHLLRRLAGSQRGSTIVEFALLAPVMFAMMIGVFQVALYMQNYNAVRSVVSDTVRFVTVEYQKENDLNADEIHAILLSQAVGDTYMLDTDRIEIDIDPVGTSRVAGATEFSIQVSYTLEDWLPFVDLEETTLTYARPLFVVNPA